MLLKRNLDSVEDWIDSYFESLAKGSRQSIALALKHSNFPKALYRYRSLERLAYILEELRDGYVFLSNPANFNDPYDSTLSTSYEQVEKQILEKWGPEYGFDLDAISKFFGSSGEKEKDLDQRSFGVLVGGILSVSYGPGAVADNQNFFSIFRNLIPVSCFTTNPNSVVMWSHYANQHKGICVEYSNSSTLSNAKFLELLHPVRYTDKFLDAFQLFSSIAPEITLDQTPPPTPSEVNFDPLAHPSGLS